MQTKTLILAVIAILLGGFVFLVIGDNDDQETANQLARQQSRITPDDLPEATSGENLPDIFRLTSQLTAERAGMRGNWVIRDAKNASTVWLPFPPTKDGELPKGKTDDESNLTDDSSSNPGFMGASACADCHRGRHDGFIQTAHHQTSGTVEPGNAKGHFTEPRNILKTRDQNLFFTMKRLEDRYVQEVAFRDWNLELPVDVFTGSAKSGQSFLYWHQDALYQSHVSYLSEPDQWTASPGYSDTTALYTRVVRPVCLECHITYVELKRTPNVYHRDSAIWGISCERCHGPGRQHVEFHRDHPDAKEGQHIVHPTNLSREQQLDICGQCHSGSFSLRQDAFSYRPGDELDDYHKLINPDSKGVGGIHTSNQLTRLRLSECFQNSEMTCTTCHDPHQNQHGNVAVFTKGCLRCHEPEHCGMSKKLGKQVAENCIGCHMPVGDLKGMTLQLSRGTFTVSMRDHYIRVDEASTNAYLAK